MKTLRFALLLGLNFVPLARAEDVRYFRVVGPIPSDIIGFTADGYITWTNAATDATFTVQTAQTLVGPSNWVDYIQVPITNTVTIHRLYDPNPPPNMSLIPAGSFMMGNCMEANESDSDELPVHRVYISAFYMDNYEVTTALWDEVFQWAITNGYGFSNNLGPGKAANHPMHYISWYDAIKWCNARSEKKGRTPAYYTDANLTLVYRRGQMVPYVKWESGYRLPTEAEWEKAARGGASGHRYPWSHTDNIDHSLANYSSSASYAYDTGPTRGEHPRFNDGVQPYTSPVDYFAPNGYGVHDMAGNNTEWCWDVYISTWYYQAGASQNDTKGPPFSSGLRVIRDGGGAGHHRTAERDDFDPTYKTISIGFRTALSADQP